VVLTVSYGAQVVAQAPVQGLEIVTPPVYRKIGTGVVVRIDGQLYSIEFDTVYQAEKLAATNVRVVDESFLRVSPLPGEMRPHTLRQRLDFELSTLPLALVQVGLGGSSAGTR
jgi:hypothetical protein